MCQALHAWCRKCWVRGHDTAIHGAGNVYSAGRIRRDFIKIAPCGLLTSAIFLRTPKPIKSFYRAGFAGSTRILASAETRLAGHIYPLDEAEVEAARDAINKSVEAIEKAYRASGVGDGPLGKKRKPKF